MGDLFELGKVVATARLHDCMTRSEYFNTFVGFCLSLYISGNWGKLDPEDWKMNDEGVVNGDRLLASYPIPYDLRKEADDEDKIWIITEWDRSVTTILFPSDY